MKRRLQISVVPSAICITPFVLLINNTKIIKSICITNKYAYSLSINSRIVFV